MQDDEHPGEIAPPSPLDHSAVLLALWPSLCTDDRRALRRCCTAMRDAVDAQADRVEGQADSPVLSPAACARLNGVHTLLLRSMACMRRMLLVAPNQPLAGAIFPRLQSCAFTWWVMRHEAGALPLHARTMI
jgi:hypothetical protein